MLVAVLGSSCGWFTEPQPSSIQGTPPRQIKLAAGPRMFRVPDSSIVVIEVTAQDSTLHRDWIPSTVVVATSRGFVGEFVMRPFACLEPTSDASTTAFPFNFSWLACDRVGLISATVLTDAEIRDIERALSGTRTLTFAFKTKPGAQYEFAVPVGRASTAQAMRVLRDLRPGAEVYQPMQEPRCRTFDSSPPPPCPPWTLLLGRPFSVGSVSPDILPVEAGGWIEARYLEPSGVARITRIRVDEL